MMALNPSVESHMLGRREGGDALGVAQQHMQEFVTDDCLDVLIGTAVFPQERQIHEQARTRLTRDRERWGRSP